MLNTNSARMGIAGSAYPNDGRHSDRREPSKTKILLMGNPNVGKSIFFTELTGIHAMSSNYAGTTVTFMEGRFKLGEKEYTLVDVPGTYSLDPTSEAETVATEFVKSGAAAIICVLDASNLERNLRLALELQQYNIPIVYALNLWDIAERHGIEINAKLLEQELGAPVVPTVAVKKQGLNELLKQLENMLSNTKSADHACENANCTSCPFNRFGKHGNDVFTSAKEISRRVSRKTKSNLKFIDKLGASMVKPFPGIPIALLVMALAIAAVVFGGRGLRAGFLLPLVQGLNINGVYYGIVPLFQWIFTAIIPEGMLLNILIGEFGIFVISFEWILALIFPYVLLFYVVFTFLEDTGYLPRISVLFDNIMRKLGVQGGSLIHTIMGYGCAVPAIIGSRAATSRKERIVIAVAICFAIPCISQTGALISLFGEFAWWMLPAIFGFSILLFILVTLIAGKFVKGKVDPLIIEVPNLLMPNGKAFGRKLATRMRHFLKDAEKPMLIAIIIAAVLAESGLLAIIATHAEPLVSGWLGLPSEAVTALILGIVRREMSVAPLLALELTTLQAFVGGVVSLMYIPCISVFAILAKEFKAKIAIIISLGTIASALFVGGLINHIGVFFGG
ncbi:MAG: ferrous iron transporter B [Oscillospiraceae bacterium]|nr:ferrous iron transporter B [Oscillospiraceae bacterium]